MSLAASPRSAPPAALRSADHTAIRTATRTGPTREQRGLAGTAETVFLILTLLLMSGALGPFYVDSTADKELSEGNPVFQLLSGTVYVIAAALLVGRLGEAARLARQNWPLVALVGLALLSATWSATPEVTFRRATALALTLMLAFCLACRLPPARFLRLLGWAMLIVAVGSIVAALAVPSIGKHTVANFAGLWRGLLLHKNSLGRVMALAIIVFWFLRRDRSSWQSLSWIGIPLAALPLFMSDSRTAWLSLITAMGSLPLAYLLGRRRMTRAVRVLGVGLAVVLGAVFVGAVLDPILQLSGRDLTLTGRTTLWAMAIEAGWQNPLLGAGYRSFWTETGAAAVYESLSYRSGLMGNGHNGYLDVWLELGFVGLGMFVVVVAIALQRAIAVLVTSGRPEHAWYALIVVFLLVYSVAERVLLQHGDIAWLIFSVNFLYLGRWAAQRKAALRRAARAWPAQRPPFGMPPYRMEAPR